MKTRIISALLGTVILFAVLFCPWTWVFAVAVALLAAIAVWELLHNTGAVPGKSLPCVSMLIAACEVLLIYCCQLIDNMDIAFDEVGWATHKLIDNAVILLPIVYLLFVTVWWLCMRKRVKAPAIGYAVLLTAYATLGFTSMVLLRLFGTGNDGLWYILLLLIIPFMSDTGAYFVGTFFGKHKMAPIISPKKSWEGFFGGWVFSILCAALLGVLYNALMNQYGLYAKPLLNAAIAAVLAPISVCGDLLASKIKRHYGIKDYGNLMPGHGGVMDRFDSVLIIAPLLFIFTISYPWIVG